MTDAPVHVYPENDLIEHDTDDGDCTCGPTTEAVPRDDGSYGWVVIHHSLDGREFRERDYAGPGMSFERAAQTMHPCPNCGARWPSPLAAELCCDPDPDDDRHVTRSIN